MEGRSVKWEEMPRNVPSLNSVRILVVEDEADACEAIRTALNRYGAEVRTAGSARDAIETFKNFRPDVLVSDIGLPGEDGYALIKRWRALEKGEPTPAVALTAYAREEDRRQALVAGYQMHVSKPVEPLELARVIAGLVRQSGSGSNHL